jgi:hypothetical protein
MIEKIIPIRYGYMSLIGTPRTRPVSWGNYHSIYDGDKDYRVVNMWKENLEDAEERWLKDGKVEVRIYSNFLLIIDKRIVDRDYFYHPLHMNYMRIDPEEAKDAYDYWGDPDYEYEQFVDPKSYYKKRGQDYDEKTGTIRMNIGAQSKTLAAEWTIENKEDVK